MDVIFTPAIDYLVISIGIFISSFIAEDAHEKYCANKK